MPLFGGSKFKLRKATPRKAKFLPPGGGQKQPQTKGNDLSRKVTLKVGCITSVFENGEWHCDIPKSKEDIDKEVLKSRMKAEKVEKVNNMLRVKVDVLLDTVTLQRTQIKVLEKEVWNLRRILSRYPQRLVKGDEK